MFGGAGTPTEVRTHSCPVAALGQRCASLTGGLPSLLLPVCLCGKRARGMTRGMVWCWLQRFKRVFAPPVSDNKKSSIADAHHMPHGGKRTPGHSVTRPRPHPKRQAAHNGQVRAQRREGMCWSVTEGTLVSDRVYIKNLSPLSPSAESPSPRSQHCTAISHQ